MGATVVATADPLRFGDPYGPKASKVRWVAEGVVDGIWQYGNALGVPNMGGDIVFNESFDDNCLVNVVSLGIVRRDQIIRSRAPPLAGAAGYDVILIGKPTDSSGLGGVTFASEALREEDDELPAWQNLLATRGGQKRSQRRERSPVGLDGVLRVQQHRLQYFGHDLARSRRVLRILLHLALRGLGHLDGFRSVLDGGGGDGLPDRVDIVGRRLHQMQAPFHPEDHEEETVPRSRRQQFLGQIVIRLRNARNNLVKHQRHHGRNPRLGHQAQTVERNLFAAFDDLYFGSLEIQDRVACLVVRAQFEGKPRGVAGRGCGPRRPGG